MVTRGTKRKAGRFGLRQAAALGLIATVTVLAAPPPAGAVFVAGACVLDVTLDGVGTVDVEPGQPTWSVSGSGPCVVTGHVGLVTGTLSGSLTGAHATSAGCAVGVYTGTLAFEADPAFGEVHSTLVVAVMAGPVLEITTASLPTFAGAGVFAQTSTGATAACPLNGNDVTTWKGAFAFEDPTLA